MQTLTGVSKFCLALGIALLVGATACGSSGSPTTVHTTGHFSNASLNGSYVYQIHGAFVSNTGALVPYREVGVFTADGNGNLSGTDDSSLSATALATTGSYTVGSDGTGFITLNTSSLGTGIQFAITLISTSSFDLIENDANINAAGTAQLQDSTAIGTTPSGTFVFRLHQEQSAQTSTQEASQVGAFSVANASGSGAMDQYLGNQSASVTSPTITIAFAAPDASGTGTATLTDGTGFNTGLIYYIVNSSQLVLLVDPNVNTGAVGSGSAELQAASASAGLSGSYAFGSRGDDFGANVAGFDGVATVGQLNASNGAISGTEDLMQDGSFTGNVNLTGCYSTGAVGGINGRVAITDCQSQTPMQVFWMVSSSRAFFLDITSGQFEDGTADLQTASSFSTSTLNGQFAMVMDGIDLTLVGSGGGELLLSRLGTIQFNSAGTLNLSELVNELNGGQTTSLTGTYNVSGNGRITGSLSNSNGPLNLVMYAISGSQAYVLQQDGGLVTSGIVQLQQQ